MWLRCISALAFTASLSVVLGQETDSSKTVTFQVVVKIPGTYSYYATPGVEYRTVVMRDHDDRSYRSGSKEGDRMDGDWYAFTSRGDTAVLERWTSDSTFLALHQCTSSSLLVKRVVYWQPVPGTQAEFLFVSNKGFVAVDDGVAIRNSVAPDNVIEDDTDPETRELIYWIWKNGRKKLLKTQ